MDLNMTREQLNTRGGMLDEIIQKCFDMAIVVDTDCKIIHLAKTRYCVFPDPERFVGRPISVIDNLSPFLKVVKTGREITGLLLEIDGRKSISNIFPIMDGNEVIGALGTVLFHNIATIKKIFAEVQNQTNSSAVGEIYQNMALAGNQFTFNDFIGESSEVVTLIEKCKKAANSKYPILIIGETGTGKEIIAEAIHSARTSGKFSPYVTINCTAIPENLMESELFGYEKGAFTGAQQRKTGKFEQVENGDILLDEIGDMSLALQSKMLRVLESKEFERVGGHNVIPFRAGVIAATNKNLLKGSEEGIFRSDLYYRLSVIELFIPPLRSRKGDISLLIEHFMRGKQSEIRLAKSAYEYLIAYHWPGNARQLKNLINRLMVLYDSKQITAELVEKELTAGNKNYNSVLGGQNTPPPTQSLPSATSLKTAERMAIEAMLKQCEFNMAQAARSLGISRATLYNKIKEHKL